MSPKHSLTPRSTEAGRRAGRVSVLAGEEGPAPSRPLRQIHGFTPKPTADGEHLELDADHRATPTGSRITLRRPQVRVGLNQCRAARFAANGAWLAVQVMAHNLARWTARIGLGERTVITKTLRRRVFALVGRITRSARRLTLHHPRRWPWETQFSRALARLQAIPFPA